MGHSSQAIQQPSDSIAKRFIKLSGVWLGRQVGEASRLRTVALQSCRSDLQSCGSDFRGCLDCCRTDSAKTHHHHGFSCCDRRNIPQPSINIPKYPEISRQYPVNIPQQYPCQVFRFAIAPTAPPHSTPPQHSPTGLFITGNANLSG